MSTVTEDNERISYLNYGYNIFNTSLNNDVLGLELYKLYWMKDNFNSFLTYIGCFNLRIQENSDNQVWSRHVSNSASAIDFHRQNCAYSVYYWLIRYTTVTSRGSHGYGLKSRDTVEIAVTPFKMAAPIGRTLNQFNKVIFFQKVIFLWKPVITKAF